MFFADLDAVAVTATIGGVLVSTTGYRNVADVEEPGAEGYPAVARRIVVSVPAGALGARTVLTRDLAVTVGGVAYKLVTAQPAAGDGALDELILRPAGT